MANLVQGSRGREVVTLQQALNTQLFPRPGLAEDGIFGPLTKSAVVAFQRQAGIGVDGIVGPQTRAALGMPQPDRSFTHRIRLHFRSISDTVVPFNSILASTQEVYAQFDIKVEFASGLSLGLSADEAAQFEQIDGTCTWNITAGEFADLLKKGGPVPSHEITVFFVDRFSESINGCGGHLPDRPACIVAKRGSRFCTAHEVCHVLLGSGFSPVHITDTNNLMHPVDISRSRVPTLTTAQISAVKASTLCVSL